LSELEGSTKKAEERHAVKKGETRCSLLCSKRKGSSLGDYSSRKEKTGKEKFIQKKEEVSKNAPVERRKRAPQKVSFADPVKNAHASQSGSGGGIMEKKEFLQKSSIRENSGKQRIA